MGLDCGNGGLGAATHVTASFAFAAVGRILKSLLQPQKVSD
jgi:tRNA A37 threonylcarbamoyladenosine dehydratase